MRFAIDIGAINNSITPSHLKRILHRWQRFGILVYPSRRDKLLAKAIDRLAPVARKHWKTTWQMVLNSNPHGYRWDQHFQVQPDLRRLGSPNALAGFGNQFEVAALAEDYATELGIPDGESRYFGGIEAVRLCDIDQSETFLRSEELSSAPIGHRDNINSIWDHRFRRLSAYSKEVAIVDQYAARPRNLRGILRLLRYLDRDSRNCHVTVYSSLDPDRGRLSSTKTTIQAEIANFSGHGIKSVHVLLFREADFRRYAHDRHLRFDQTVFRIGRGTRVFEHVSVRESTDVDMVTLRPNTREQKEADLDDFGTIVHAFRLAVA